MLIKRAATYGAILAMTASLAACSTGDPIGIPTDSQTRPVGASPVDPAASATPIDGATADAPAAPATGAAFNDRSFDDSIGVNWDPASLSGTFPQAALDNLIADGKEMTYLLNDGEMAALTRAHTTDEGVAALQQAKPYFSSDYFGFLTSTQTPNAETANLLSFFLTIPSVNLDGSVLINEVTYDTNGVDRPIRMVPMSDVKVIPSRGAYDIDNYAQYIRTVQYTVTTTTAVITWDAELKYNLLANSDNHWFIAGVETGERANVVVSAR